jgi:hypothetical protein
MSAIKDWMMDMEDAFWEAYSPGMHINQVLRKVQKNVAIVDEKYIRRLYNEVEGI